MFNRLVTTINNWFYRSTIHKVTALTSEKIAIFHTPKDKKTAAFLQIKNIWNHATTQVEFKDGAPVEAMHINNQTLVETEKGDIHFFDEKQQRCAVVVKTARAPGSTLVKGQRMRESNCIIAPHVDWDGVRCHVWEVTGTEFKKINSFRVDDISLLPTAASADGLDFSINFPSTLFGLTIAYLHIDFTTQMISRNHYLTISTESSRATPIHGEQRYKSPHNQSITLRSSSVPDMCQFFHYSKQGKFIKKIELPMKGLWQEKKRFQCYDVVSHVSTSEKTFFSILDRSDNTFIWHHQVFSVPGPVQWVLGNANIITVNANNHKVHVYDFLNTDDIKKKLHSDGSPLTKFSTDLTTLIARYACSVRVRSETSSILFPKVKKLTVTRKTFIDKLSQLTRQIKLIVELTNATPADINNWLSDSKTHDFSSLTALKHKIISSTRVQAGLRIYVSLASPLLSYIGLAYMHPLMGVILFAMPSLIYLNPAHQLHVIALNEIMGILNETIHAYQEFQTTAIAKNMDMQIMDDMFHQFKDNLQRIRRIPQHNQDVYHSLT